MTLHAAEPERAGVAAQRADWRERQPSFDPRKLIFIDETWFKTNMVRLRGRARRGQRLVGRTPHGHWKTSTFVAALRHDGVTAPGIFDGAINGDLFLAWVEQALIPALRPGDIVVMDNLSSHKVAGVRAAIKGAGAELNYLPPYIPDMNPIEMLFAKLKAKIRALAIKAVDPLWEALGKVSNEVPAKECSNFIQHARYFQSA